MSSEEFFHGAPFFDRRGASFDQVLKKHGYGMSLRRGAILDQGIIRSITF
jgi:hypothetical protein